MDLSIVVPCYNEDEALDHTSGRLLETLHELQAAGAVSGNSAIYFVDDGSQDNTWAIIERIARSRSEIHGIKLSRNCGHQHALLAGLLAAGGDALISIDADLQDDVGIIKDMVAAVGEGHDIVYGVRSNREEDTLFKRLSAEGYYRLLRWMGVDAVFNHADYRLMTRRVIEALRDYGEVNVFLRGIVPLLGYPSKRIAYTRSKRVTGETKYPLHKMITLAIEGVTSFSAVPLRLITLVGILIFVVSFLIGCWALFIAVFSDLAVPGWASTVIPTYFVGGIQLLCTGIIGEYLSKIYLEVKRRPRFHVEKIVGGRLGGLEIPEPEIIRRSVSES